MLAEALLRPPHERADLVRARCADPGLRSEVQAYLDQYDESFLESVLTVSGTMESTSSAAAAEEPALPDIQAGDRIGPYIVLDRLGVGGMGHVFLGNDTRLQRKVALKCLIASASATELRSRILHEARAAARITHPNIAIVHDVVEHDERPFLVMEYVEGENLAAVIKRERPPLDRILTITRQLASALSAAHAKGIIHRDLKPANIQVTPEGPVKILDFGVAHAMSALATGTTMPTAALTVAMTSSTLEGDRKVMHPGTPAYMSPEQMFGRKIDPRSDIYSLGVIVYEMATGHRPYSTDDPLDVVVTLSKNFLRAGGTEPPLPAQLSDVIAKMLAVKPEDRYQTAADLEAVVSALLAPPAPAREVAPPSKLRAAGRIAAIAAVTFLGVTLLGFLETAAFNLTLGRTEPFNQESPRVWVEFGFRAIVLPLFLLITIFIAVAATRFATRVLSLSRGIERLLTTSASRTARLSARLGLDDPTVLGQAVVGIGAILMGMVIWRFWPFMRAWGSSSISTQPAEQFFPLRPGRARLDAQLYVYALTALMFFFGASIARIQRLRSRQSIRQGGAAFAIVVAMALVTLLLCEWPYRIEWQNRMPRLDVAGARCYAIGEHEDERLVYCPESNPPRNRTMKRGDPSIRDLGVVENIFTPPETSPH